MILLIHHKAERVVKALKDDTEIKISSTNCTAAFWELASAYPEEIIAWCEEDLGPYLNREAFPKIFHHDLIMASYAVKTRFLPDAIGYIDQLPFVNVNRKVTYPTWQMSTDLGGIRGKALLRFRGMFGRIKGFQMLLNSVAKLGQQNGLFCYSAPQLVKQGLRPSPSRLAQPDILSFGSSSGQAAQPDYEHRPEKMKSTASKKELFSFVYFHYKSIRLLILFWCFLKYEKSFPLFPFVGAFFHKKYFQKEVDFSGIEVRSGRNSGTGENIDVIIPTMGRREYLLQVMEDLKQQTHLPQKVIVVEQNPDPKSATDLPELNNEEWPFEVVHRFIHKTGACHARNLALEEVEADWVFFADDDIRLGSELLEKSLKELKRMGVACLNINCKQQGEATVFHKIKQWGSFGSGTSIVSAAYCKKLKFDEVFEYGFGEDQDYGMQLRNAGCDVVYHPELEILHLKAPRGGFREIQAAPWEPDKPKPSPTLMLYAQKHYTPEQIKGFKTELYLRYYRRQPTKNPFKYFRIMGKRWQKSEKWAGLLQKSSGIPAKVKMEK